MYDINWAVNFSGFLSDERMDIQKFALFYDAHIGGRNFIYHTDSPKLPSFIIESEGNQLPHLMGLQHWNSLSTKQPSTQYELLKNGEWDLEFLKAADKGAWDTYQARVEFLPHLYNLLYKGDCTVKLVHKDMPSPFRNRKIDMIFQKEGSKLVYVLELREKRGVYVPASLTTYNRNAQAIKDKHDKLNIIKVTVEPHI
jgi:hypothetical protein